MAVVVVIPAMTAAVTSRCSRNGTICLPVALRLKRFATAILATVGRVTRLLLCRLLSWGMD